MRHSLRAPVIPLRLLGVLALLLAGPALAQEDGGSRDEPLPSSSGPALSAEDLEVVSNLELLDSWEHAEDLDLLVELSRED